MTKRIVIAGYYGYHNAGDEAILAGMLAALRRERSNLAFTVLSGDPASTRLLHGVEAIDATDLEAEVEAVRSSDLVIVGGGGLFHDYWGVDPTSVLTQRQAGIAACGGPVVLARLLDKPCMIYAVGVGPLASTEGRSLTRALFTLADAITVRDEASRHLLADLGCDAASIEVTADPAFEAPTVSLPEEVEAQFAGLPRPILGVALRSWDVGVDPAAWEPAIAEALDAHLDRAGGSILFIPFQIGRGVREDDRAVAERVQARMRNGGAALHLHPAADPLQRFQSVKRCNAVLGMRMHAVVGAARFEKPFVALAYDHKVETLAEIVGGQTAALPNDAEGAQAVAEALSRLVPASEQGVLPKLPAEWWSFPDARLAVELAGKNLRRPNQPEALSRILAWRTIEGIRSEVPRSWLTEAEDSLTLVRDQRDALLADRIRVERELQELRGTLGVTLLALYWDTLHRLVPEGGTARSLYAKLAGIVRTLARRAGLDGDRGKEGEGFSSDVIRAFVGTGVSSPGKGNRTFAESRAELLRFADQVTVRRDRRVIVILSTTQLVQSEGQRATNFALACSKKGIPVVFASWRWDTNPWSHQDRLGERILQLPLEQVLHYPTELLTCFPRSERILICEFPYPAFVDVVALANGRGWITVYDAIDDWDGFRDVGQAPWHRAGVEETLAASADLVTSVSGPLASKLRPIGRGEILLVPNGLVDGIEKVNTSRSLDRGEVTLGYWGYLTSTWFDWALIRKVALLEPHWVFYICGHDDGSTPKNLPGNVRRLGKRPQSELASIAANLDVGIVPFFPGRLSDGADVIKAYEYLAMGLPVVVAGVYPPEGAEDHVLRARDADEFRALVRRAAAMRHERVEERRTYARARTWGRRLDTLLEAIDRGDQRVAQKRWLFREPA